MPGQIYTLTFAYRGPAAGAWYRGEGNANDSINGNNGTPVGGTTYPAGEVGTNFNFDGTGYATIPASSTLNIGAGGGITIECWIKPGSCSPPQIKECRWWNGTRPPRMDCRSMMKPETGCFQTSVTQRARGMAIVSADGLINTNGFQHVAVTYDKNTGMAGALLQWKPDYFPKPGELNTPQTTFPLNLARRSAGVVGGGVSPAGMLDEVGLYSRALSASEIKAIYALGTNGKFDPVEFTNSPQLSLSEAGISLPGMIQTNLYGNNNAWEYTSNRVHRHAKQHTGGDTRHRAGDAFGCRHADPDPAGHQWFCDQCFSYH